MPLFSLRSQRLRGEFLSRRLPENHGIPKEPSTTFGHFAVGRTPSSAPGPWPGCAQARLGRPNEPSNLLKTTHRKLSAYLCPQKPISLISQASFRFVPQNSLFLRHRRPASPILLNHRLPPCNGVVW
jgi:hypothetical protein